MIVGANRHAGAFWLCDTASMLEKPFVTLFAFEVTSDDPDILDAQWEVLTVSASEQRAPLVIQLDADSAGIEVRGSLWKPRTAAILPGLLAST